MVVPDLVDLGRADLTARTCVVHYAACLDAGIADFHFHDLRYTFATRLGDAGCNATTIARLLGHSNIQMSMRYTYASDDSLRNAVEHAQIGRVTTASQTLKQPLTRVAVNT